MLAILSTLAVSGGTLCCMLPTCLWLCHLGTGHTGLYIQGSKMLSFRIIAIGKHIEDIQLFVTIAHNIILNTSGYKYKLY